MTRIRQINGPMPYDKYDGVNFVHATGREVWAQAASGDWCWQNEYEGDPTEDLPETEEAEDYE